MRAKAAGYTKAPRNDIDDYLPLTPTRIKSELEPMDRFKRYEEEFLNCSRNVTRTNRQLEAANGVVDSVIALSADIELELSEAEAYLRAMDVEFRTMVGVDKKTASQKVSDYRDEYKQLIQLFQTTKQKAETLALQSGASSRNKLITANQRLDQSTLTLENSRQIIAQTEGIGNTIITDLESQKEQLKHASSNAQEIKQFTFDAKVVLRTMGRRAIIHDLCMMITILVLFGIICVIIYYGFVEKKK